MLFTGSVQTFTAPLTGWYKVQLWGAKGGNMGDGANAYRQGGNGGYIEGVVNINADTDLNVYVGGACPSLPYGYAFDNPSINDALKGWPDGGGAGFNGGNGWIGGTCPEWGCGMWSGGGGSTSITFGAATNTPASEKRIMVAGGGGGSSNWLHDGNDSCAGGHGGGVIGGAGQSHNGNTDSINVGGTQSAGGCIPAYPSDVQQPPGEFGKGGESGGGGWYGGGGVDKHYGGSGGSSYAAMAPADNIAGYNTAYINLHNYRFKQVTTIEGGNNAANNGTTDDNGYARFIYIGKQLP